MPSPAPLRLVVSRADEEIPAAAARFDAARPAPPDDAAAYRAMPLAAGASFVVHAAVLLWMAVNGILGEERATGAADDLVLIEGIPVELIESAPVPEAPPSEAASESDVPAEVEEQATPPEPMENVAKAVETTEPVTPPPPEPEVQPVPEPEPIPEALPPPDAATGELAARPEYAVTVPEAEGISSTEAAEESPAEDDPQAPEAADVPTPRIKPERTEVARAEAPEPEPQEEPDEPKPAPTTPAAPPPSPPAAAQSAARSGGAGGGGASQTAGNAAASAYRAKVGAQLKRKRFYPNAARRDRLTGSATVSFTLNASGKVTAVRVVRSSGERILDDAAKEMVQRASPYPPIPPGLGSTITIQAPIAFDLPR